MKTFLGVFLFLMVQPIYAESTISNKSRWQGSVQGCLGNSTPTEIQTYGSKLPRLCTCMATYLVATCAKNDPTKSSVFATCAQKLLPNLLKDIDGCIKKGTEPDINPYKK